MEAAPIDPLEKKVKLLPKIQQRILKGARKLKAECFKRELFDRRVEIGAAIKFVKDVINSEFQIDIDDIRFNGKHGGFLKSEINGGALNGGYTDIAFTTGIQNVLLVFRCCNKEELNSKTPSSTALVIKGYTGSL